MKWGDKISHFLFERQILCPTLLKSHQNLLFIFYQKLDCSWKFNIAVVRVFPTRWFPLFPLIFLRKIMQWNHRDEWELVFPLDNTNRNLVNNDNKCPWIESDRIFPGLPWAIFRKLEFNLQIAYVSSHFNKPCRESQNGVRKYPSILLRLESRWVIAFAVTYPCYGSRALRTAALTGSWQSSEAIGILNASTEIFPDDILNLTFSAPSV